MGRPAGLPGRAARLRRRPGDRGRGADAAARARGDPGADRSRRPRPLGRVGRGRRRLRADGRDAPPALAARGARVVDGAAVPDHPPGEPPARSGRAPDGRRPGAERRRVRHRRPPLPAPRRRPGPAGRRRRDQRAAGREPRAGGDRRGSPHGHLPRLVRLPRRRRHREPAPAARGDRPVVRPAPRRPGRAPRHHRGGLRARAGAALPTWPTASRSASSSSSGSRTPSTATTTRPPTCRRARSWTSAGRTRRGCWPSRCRSPIGATSGSCGGATS